MPCCVNNREVVRNRGRRGGLSFRQRGVALKFQVALSLFFCGEATIVPALAFEVSVCICGDKGGMFAVKGGGAERRGSAAPALLPRHQRFDR